MSFSSEIRDASFINCVSLLLFTSISSWLYFQGIPILLNDGRVNVSENYIFASIFSLLLLILGIIFGSALKLKSYNISWQSSLINPLYVFIILSFPVTFIMALNSAYINLAYGYGAADAILFIQNILGYVILTIMPIFLFSAKTLCSRKINLILLLIIIPRFLVSIFGQRFYLLQAIIPIFFWIYFFKKISIKYVIVFVAIGFIASAFIMPAIRGDSVWGIENIILGSPLNLLPLIEKTNILKGFNSYSLFLCQIVSGIYDICDLTNIWTVPEGHSLRYHNALTYIIRQESGIDGIGTGGNPIIEFAPNESSEYSSGFIFFLIGGISGLIVRNCISNPLACFLLPHISSKLLFLWRGTLVEFYDRLLPLIFVYLMLKIIAKILKKIKNAAA